MKVALVTFGILLAACGGGTAPSPAPSAAATSAAVPSAAAPSAAVLSGVIKVGSPQSLTGPAAFAGTKIKQGMELATEEINSTKFLGNATISVSYVDVGATPQQAATVTRQMIEQDQVNALVGVVLGSQTPGVAAIAQSGKTPLILTGGAAPGVTATGDYITSASPQQFPYVDKMGQALKNLKVASTQVLYAQDNPTILAQVHTYTDFVFPKYGIKASLKAYLGTDTDLSAGIAQAIADKVDAIACLFVGAQGTTCLSQARSAGFKGQLWGQAGFGGGTAIQAGPVAEGLIYTAGWSQDFTYPESKKLVQLFQAKFPTESMSEFQAAGYDGLWLLAKAIKAGNGISREAIHTGLLKTIAQSQALAIGPATWDKDRNIIAVGAIIQIKNGKETLFL